MTKYHHLLSCVNIYFYPVEITVINVFFFQCLTTVLQTCFHSISTAETVRAKRFSFTFARLHGQNYQEQQHTCGSEGTFPPLVRTVFFAICANYKATIQRQPVGVGASGAFPPPHGRAVCLRVASLTEIMAGQFFFFFFNPTSLFSCAAGVLRST